MFTLTASTPMAGDGTSEYKITLDKEYTLREFIEAVLTNEGEWGSIRIAKRNCYWYDFPEIRYRYGEIITVPNLLEEIYNLKVRSAVASGGWTRMDYIVILGKKGMLYV